MTLRSTNGEIRQNYYFFADLAETVNEKLASNEGEVKWFPIEEISKLEMPFTAKYVIEHYCVTGRFTDKVYTGVTNKKGVEFIELAES